MKQQQRNWVVNQHRPFRLGQLGARYLRLRYQHVPDAPEVDPWWEHYEDEGYRFEADDFDQLWYHIESKLLGARFNSLPTLPALSGRSDRRCGHRSNGVGSPPKSARVIERTLVEHWQGLNSSSADELLRGHREDLLTLNALRNSFRDNGDNGDGDNRAPLVAALLFAPFWLRSPRTWTPPNASVNCTGRLHSLLNHLFVAYPVPQFLYAAWRQSVGSVEVRWMVWFVLLGQGGSLRRMTNFLRAAPDAPVQSQIGNKFSALLHRVPDSPSLAEGSMWAEVMRLGGSEAEMRRLRLDQSYVIEPTSHEEDSAELLFWREAVHWLIRHRPDLDQRPDQHWRVIAAWARHERIERQTELQCFRWTGRTPVSMIEQAQDYWRAVTQLRHGARDSSWRGRNWNWTMQSEQGEWTIHELTTSQALRNESKALRHCVAGYDARCAIGSSAIFSLQRDGKRLLTIEVRPRSRLIVQALGACNRSASAFEKTVIACWRREVLNAKR